MERRLIEMKNKKLRKICMSMVILVFIVQLCGCGAEDTPNALEDMALIDIINAMYDMKTPELSLHQDIPDLQDSAAMESYTGLSDTSNVKEVTYSEPMIGSQAYSLVLVRVKDESKVEETATAMKENVNPAKWICVMADDLQVVSYRDVILLFMVSSELSDVITSEEIVDSFQNVCGDDITTY